MTLKSITVAHPSKGRRGPLPVTSSVLARQVIKKRESLRLLQTDAARLEGISAGSWRAVEQGKRPSNPSRVWTAINHFLCANWDTVHNSDGSMTVKEVR